MKALDDFRQQNLGLVDLYLPAQMHDKAMFEYLQKVQQEVVDVYKNAHQDLVQSRNAFLSSCLALGCVSALPLVSDHRTL